MTRCGKLCRYSYCGKQRLKTLIQLGIVVLVVNVYLHIQGKSSRLAQDTISVSQSTVDLRDGKQEGFDETFKHKKLNQESNSTQKSTKKSMYMIPRRKDGPI
ncbi:hypothetical protein ScPMuIL_010105 [Solemya velum]